LGFTEDDRNNYIRSSLKGNAKEITPLMEYLKNNPTISSLCFTPFNMTMLLWLYKNGVLTNSSAVLCNHFICHTICHYLVKNQDNSSCKDLNSHHQCYKNAVQQLSSLSYKACDKDPPVFTLDEVKAVWLEIDETPGAIYGFGLLQAVQYLMVIMKTQTLLSFVHSSLETHLASCNAELSDTKECIAQPVVKKQRIESGSDIAKNTKILEELHMSLHLDN